MYSRWQQMMTAMVVSVGATASAAPVTITVPNGSFQTPNINADQVHTVNTVPDWTVLQQNLTGTATGNARVFVAQPGNNYGGAAQGAADGDANGVQVAMLSHGDKVNGTIGIRSASSLVTIQPLTEYIMTVALGRRDAGNNIGTLNANNQIILSILAGTTTVLASATPNPVTVSGHGRTLVDYSVSFTTGTTDLAIGQGLHLSITLSDNNNDDPITRQMYIDKVRLTSEVIPEPAGLLGLGLAGLVLTRRRH